jgi:mRNA interferase HigB
VTEQDETCSTITICYSPVVRVIARSRLLLLAKTWPEARTACDEWCRTVERLTWTDAHHLKASDPRASILPHHRVVFDILGGRFRLVVRIDYTCHMVFIRFFGTHKQYERIDATKV